MNNANTWIKSHPFKTILLVLCTIPVMIIIGFIVEPSTPPSETQQTNNTASSTPAMTKEEAEKDLEEFMAMSKKAGIIMSYDFSKIDEKLYRWEIYVGKNWYLQTAPQKKDFIAYIGLRKKAITGFTNFQLHDGYSNEKVGEITAFSQSIEVYK